MYNIKKGVNMFENKLIHNTINDTYYLDNLFYLLYVIKTITI